MNASNGLDDLQTCVNMLRGLNALSTFLFFRPKIKVRK